MPGWEEESGEPFAGMGEVRFMTIEMTFEKKEEGKRKRETRSYNVYPSEHKKGCGGTDGIMNGEERPAEGIGDKGK